MFSSDRFKKLGQKLLKSDPVRERPAHVKNERRSGRRIPLRIAVRIKINDGVVREARIRDVNMPGLAVEPDSGAAVGDRVNVGFDGYPDVAPAFAITARVRRILKVEGAGAPTPAMGLEIDRDATSADALKNYRRLVLHYLHHRPLLDDLNKGYFEGRCTSCEWIGRVGRRNPTCARCGAVVDPV